MRRDKTISDSRFRLFCGSLNCAIAQKNAIAGKATRENSQIRCVYRLYNVRESNDGHAHDFLSRGARNKFVLTAANLRQRLMSECIYLTILK